MLLTKIDVGPSAPPITATVSSSFWLSPTAAAAKRQRTAAPAKRIVLPFRFPRIPFLFFPAFFLRPKLLKEILQHTGAFLPANSNFRFHLMVKAFFMEQIQNRSGAARFGIHAPDHNLRNPGLDNRPGAHGARLQRHEQLALPPASSRP